MRVLVEMKQFLFLVLIISNILQVSSLICYYGMSNSSIPLITLDTSITSNKCNNDTCVCSNYKYACTSGDVSCTTAEQQAQVQKWVWTVLANTTCQQMLAIPTTYMSVTCCYTNYCNNQNLNIGISIKSSYYIHVLYIAMIFFCNK